LTVTGTDAGYDADGLCLRPDGSGVAAWFPIFDALIDVDKAASQEPPRIARLGRLGVFSGDEQRFIDVETEAARDLLINRQVTVGPDGSEVFQGYRIGVDFYEAQPFFLDEHRVLLNSPSGFVFCIDTESGQTEVRHDLGSPIRALDFHRETQRLLAGCEDNSVRLLAALG
jgi:hypothetical protein